jgi:hypothetical protein
MRIENVEEYFGNIFDSFFVNDYRFMTTLLYSDESGKIQYHKKARYTVGNYWFIAFVFALDGRLLYDKKIQGYKNIDPVALTDYVSKNSLTQDLGLCERT